MCGIAGILSREPSAMDELAEMTRRIAHRGPDGEGFLYAGRTGPARLTHRWPYGEGLVANLALSHRRLAIIDTSEGGFQPMSTPDRRLWIAYNGEIYNYLELRRELEALGERFRSDSDTEIVLRAFSLWGTRCFERFNGMWAIAIWDDHSKTLTLSRDRFGVKPLYWGGDAARLVFGSEIKALLAPGLLRARINWESVGAYLRLSLVDHSTQTFFDGISAFPPGHFAVVGLDAPSRIEPVRFWSLEPDRGAQSLSYTQAAAHFAELLESSVALRLRSDVPVGSCLSGGLDSSSIVCVVDRLRRAPADGRGEHAFHTFTAGNEDASVDERDFANVVNRATGCTSHLTVPSCDGLLADLDRLVWHQDEPFTTASIYAQWCVMRAAREASVPVLLDGQGADECLCGYRKYYAFRLIGLLSAGRPGAAMREFASLLARGDSGLLRLRGAGRYLPRRLRRAASPTTAMLRGALRDAHDGVRIDIGVASDIRSRQIADLTAFSLPSLLRYEDRNSMAWSIESRVPFLDYRLVSFVLGLPDDYKLRGGRTKAVLRDAMAGTVPAAILDRRDKVGFETAQDRWMRGGLGESIRDRLVSGRSRLAPWLDHGRALDVLASARGGRSTDARSALVRLHFLDRWLERFDVAA